MMNLIIGGVFHALAFLLLVNRKAKFLP